LLLNLLKWLFLLKLFLLQSQIFHLPLSHLPGIDCISLKGTCCILTLLEDFYFHILLLKNTITYVNSILKDSYTIIIRKTMLNFLLSVHSLFVSLVLSYLINASFWDHLYARLLAQLDVMLCKLRSLETSE
jgi:ABC-type antimicrobial peptide transport system permease subunit